ncbi:ras-related protein Rab-3C isoform X1 [Antennarius striatus]
MSGCGAPYSDAEVEINISDVVLCLWADTGQKLQLPSHLDLNTPRPPVTSEAHETHFPLLVLVSREPASSARGRVTRRKRREQLPGAEIGRRFREKDKREGGGNQRLQKAQISNPYSAKNGKIHIEPRPSKQMAATQDVKGKGEGGDQNFDYMFKLLIIGNSSVGKTSFLFRYADDAFTSAFVSTVGIDFKVKTVYKNDKRIKLQIWDTAGQERYRTITTAYYRGAMGFILMYDITNEESFGAVQDWSTQIKTYSWDNAQVVLAGNKCDMDEERVVSVDSGRLLAEQLGFEFFETSAKDNINVKQTFERLVDLICDKMSESLDTDPVVTTGAPTAKLTDSAPPLQQPGCNC